MDADILALKSIIELQTKQIEGLANANEKMFGIIQLLSSRIDVIDKKVEINHEAIDFLSGNFSELCKIIGEAEIKVEE